MTIEVVPGHRKARLSTDKELETDYIFILVLNFSNSLISGHRR